MIGLWFPPLLSICWGVDKPHRWQALKDLSEFSCDSQVVRGPTLAFHLVDEGHFVAEWSFSTAWDGYVNTFPAQCTCCE